MYVILLSPPFILPGGGWNMTFRTPPPFDLFTLCFLTKLCFPRCFLSHKRSPHTPKRLASNPKLTQNELKLMPKSSFVATCSFFENATHSAAVSVFSQNGPPRHVTEMRAGTASIKNPMQSIVFLLPLPFTTHFYHIFEHIWGEPPLLETPPFHSLAVFCIHFPYFVRPCFENA